MAFGTLGGSILFPDPGAALRGDHAHQCHSSVPECQRLVAGSSPLDLLQRAVAGAEDVPDAGARAEDGDVSLAIAIEVAGDGHVTRRAPLDLLQGAVTGAHDVPRPGARAEDGDVGRAVPVVVGGHGDVPAGRAAPGGLDGLTSGENRE